MNLAVSAPGKAILMGEHAAVYGGPALVAAVDRRMELELTVDAEPGLRLVLPQVGVDERRPWSEVVRYAEDRRRAWQRWRDAAGAEPFETVLGKDPGHLVWTAFGEALLYLGTAPVPGATVHMHSRIPLGSGFGSSAAASVAAVTALPALAGAEAPPERIYQLSLEAERRQHGTPSGVDNATVIRGGVLWVEKRDGELVTEDVEPKHRGLLDRLRIYHSGTPGQSTGEVVAAVGARRNRDPAAFDRELAEACRRTADFRRLLEAESCDDGEVLDVVREFGAWLEHIGAVPPRIRALFRRVEAAGGAAKISGAGALSGPGAGSLLLFHPDPAVLDTLLESEDVERLDLSFGGPGLRAQRKNAP